MNKEERKKEKEELHEELMAGKTEIRKALSETVDPNGDKKISLKEIFHEMFSIRKDVATREQIRESLISGGRVTGTNMCLLVLAILIASIGLNVNSTAVIIGAMLISPLMGTIHAFAYGTATSDSALSVRSVLGFAMQVLISLCASTLYFTISPLSDATSELLARTQPTIWDVLIAICGGVAGIIGVTRKEKSNVIPGVAIATALMPPLCTCGYSIANTNWHMLSDIWCNWIGTRWCDDNNVFFKNRQYQFSFPTPGNPCNINFTIGVCIVKGHICILELKVGNNTKENCWNQQNHSTNYKSC